MNKEYADMELNVLTCLILDATNMEKLKIEDKYFVNYKRFWKFIKTFYEKYKTLDIALMVSFCQSRKDLVCYLEMVCNNLALQHHFDYYQDRLVEMANESIKDKVIANKVYDLATDLLLKKINPREFDEKYQQLLKDCQQ